MPPIFSGLCGRLLAAAAVVAGILVAVFRLIGIGRQQERAAQAERINETVEKAREVDRRVDAADDAELERLRRRWTR